MSVSDKLRFRVNVVPFSQVHAGIRVVIDTDYLRTR